MALHPRLAGTSGDLPLLCDAWLVEELRFGDHVAGLAPEQVLGQWPAELETGAVVQLAEAAGAAADWSVLAELPPVVRNLDERARLQPLDQQLLLHLRHLQHVCHKPRLHLRVEEERLPVARARRVPVRAVADLVSHPGDWEHRTLRSIQPSRVLARQIEDEWNLYENRVAVRLVDHLLAYLARRLEELRKIEEALTTGRDHGDEARTSFWRARRIMTLWAKTLSSGIEEELRQTMSRLDHAQRDLQALLGSPLYLNVPGRASVALSIKPTNILVNDPHYRKVAALWRAWVKLGHRRHETQQQRATRRQREAAAWDRFVLHLIARGFRDLGWSVRPEAAGWLVERDGFSAVSVVVDGEGVVCLEGGGQELRFLPLCAELSSADPDGLLKKLEAWDSMGVELVAVHVGKPAALSDADRCTGWSFDRRATLFACSPWSIDAEERMARLLRGWVNRTSAGSYPAVRQLPALPKPPAAWGWLQYQGDMLVILKKPDASEATHARDWAKKQVRDLTLRAQQAKLARQAQEVAPLKAAQGFQEFLEEAIGLLQSMDICPICGGQGVISPRPGRRKDGGDTTWWARCQSCQSQWGLRHCTSCNDRYRALAPQTGLDLSSAALGVTAQEWPDKVLGRDVWAQPCRAGTPGQFRCPRCGGCSSGSCAQCGTQ